MDMFKAGSPRGYIGYLFALLVGLGGGNALAAAPAVDALALAQALEGEGLEGALEIAQAVAAHARGAEAEAEARLEMGLLANGIVDVRHAGGIRSALERTSTRARSRAVTRFLDKWMAGAGVGSGLSGVMTAAGFRAMKKAGGAVDPPRGEGGVVLKVSPANAEVRVDGILVQGSPAVFRGVPAGFRAVEVRSPGHRAMEGMIRVSPLRVATGVVRLEESGAVLRVESNPVGAMVSIAGVERGATPLMVDGLEPGSHRIVVSAEGRQDWSQKVRLKRGNNRVDATLVPLPVRLPPPRRVQATKAQLPAPPKPPKAAAVPAPAPVVAAAPAPAPPPRRDGADLRLLSGDLQRMTWESLRGRAVEIEVKGRRATVVVVALQGDQVIVQPPGKTRRFKIPIQDISWVVQ